jgi:hypothetical protein
MIVWRRDFLLSPSCMFSFTCYLCIFRIFLCCLCHWPYGCCACTLVRRTALSYYYYYYYYYYFDEALDFHPSTQISVPLKSLLCVSSSSSHSPPSTIIMQLSPTTLWEKNDWTTGGGGRFWLEWGRLKPRQGCGGCRCMRPPSVLVENNS